MTELKHATNRDFVAGGEIFPTRIYVMKDPRDGMVRYVGKTIQSLQKRLTGHMEQAFDFRSGDYKGIKAQWIRELYDAGYLPTIETVEICEANWSEREIFWISHYNQLGFNLLNMTSGGEYSKSYALRPHPSQQYQPIPRGHTSEVDARLERLASNKPRTSNARDIVKITRRECDPIPDFNGVAMAYEVFFVVYYHANTMWTVRELTRKLHRNPSARHIQWIFDKLEEKGIFLFREIQTAGRTRRGYIHRDFKDKEVLCPE